MDQILVGLDVVYGNGNIGAQIWYSGSLTQAQELIGLSGENGFGAYTVYGVHKVQHRQRYQGKR